MKWYERIKERRIELGLTQQELADMMGYKSKTTINKIELGKNDIPQSRISEFCKILKLSESQLMGYGKNSENFGELSDDEIELVKKYRELSNELKGFVLQSVSIEGAMNANHSGKHGRQVSSATSRLAGVINLR